MDEIKKAGQRYAEIFQLLRKTNDKVGLDLLNDLVKSCMDYFSFVQSMERTINLIRFREESWDQRDRISALDEARSRMHNSLISKLTAFNRYLFTMHDPSSVPIGGIFSLDPAKITERAIVGDWAMYLAQSFK